MVHYVIRATQALGFTHWDALQERRGGVPPDVKAEAEVSVGQWPSPQQPPHPTHYCRGSEGDNRKATLAGLLIPILSGESIPVISLSLFTYLFHRFSIDNTLSGSRCNMKNMVSQDTTGSRISRQRES